MMGDQATYHEGYAQALKDAATALEGAKGNSDEKLTEIREFFKKGQGQANIISKSALAASASGNQGY